MACSCCRTMALPISGSIAYESRAMEGMIVDEGVRAGDCAARNR